MQRKRFLQRFIILTLAMLPGLLWASTSQILKMKIEGMTCGMCARKVQAQLSPLCKDISIDREKGEGFCLYEAPVTPDQILTEANKTGFKTSKLNP